MDKVLNSIGCDNYSCYWLKRVRVVFLLEEGPLESFSGCCERLEVDLIAIVVAVEIEVDFIDCCRGKQSGGSMFPTVVALVYVGV